MFRLEGGRPNDRRGFLHKSKFGRFVGGAVSTFVPAVGIAKQALGIGQSLFRKAPARPVAPRTLTARPSFGGAQGKEEGRRLKFSQGFGGPALPVQTGLPFLPATSRSECNAGESAICCRLRNGSIAEQAAWQTFCGTAGDQQRPGRPATGVGDAVMGRYGAALEPGVMMIERSVCLPGMTLGNDGLCYNKGAITNKQRQWPRGRRPLLTGGDMRAIGIAARAGSKLDRTTKRLRALGMMKALPKGRGAPRAHAHAKQIAAVSVPS